MSCFAPVIAALGSLTAPSPAASAVVFDAEGPALAIGANGLGIFAYRDRTNGDLMVGRCVDAACTTVTTTVVDSIGDVGREADIAIAPDGPVIVYEDSTNHAIKLALCVDPACAASNTVVVDPNIGDGVGAAVAMGADGRPLVAYIARPPGQTLPRMKVAHCDNAACSAFTITDAAPTNAVSGLGVDVAIGADGLGAMVYTNRFLVDSEIVYVHCANPACTAFTPLAVPRAGSSASRPEGNFTSDAYPSLDTKANGVPSWAGASRFIGGEGWVFLRRCQSPTDCNVFPSQTFSSRFHPPSLAIDSADRPRIVLQQWFGQGLDLFTCEDPACAQFQRACLAGLGEEPSLALDGTGLPLVAYEAGDNLVVMTPPPTCAPALLVGDVSRPEAAGVMQFSVRLGPPVVAPVTVNYTTVDGTAQAGVDYVAASGTITFPQQQIGAVVLVQLLPDALDEPDETFTLVLSNPSGAAILDGEATGTIVDDDVLPTVGTDDCAVIEGDTGTTGCVFEARLTAPYPVDVTVQYATAPGTATAGIDYLSQSGTLTFAPGSLAQAVSVSVVGDVTAEPDETFALLLSNPVDALPGDMTGDATIVDDDAPSFASLEVSHGLSVTADLAAPGPVADQDLYHVAQAPFASYEAVLDAISGDAAPGARVQRVAADGSTVLQPGAIIGTGTAVSLRFQNRLAAPVSNQYLRVAGASCGTACGPDDTYRLRFYETTGVIPRFNNSGSQVTVLLLQNPTAATIDANVDFWDANGARLATQSASVPPHGLFALNTSTVAALASTSGTITVSHDGPYGALAGKSVALEPATGFSFDSPMTTKPR